MNCCGYGKSYGEGRRLWREHHHDNTAQKVLDEFWHKANGKSWNDFANGYDDAKNDDGEPGRGPRKWF